MKTARWSAVAAAPFVISACFAAGTGQEQRAAWLDEFAALRIAMAAQYANLDWIADHRHVDLPALRSSVEAELRKAQTVRQARRAIERFVAAFDDPHLRVVDLHPPERGNGKSEDRDRSCSELGFKSGNRKFRFPFDEAKGWTTAGGKWFPAGSFGEVGVIRVADFREDQYREACEDVGPKRVRERLTGELRATIRELEARSISLLAVDLTGNGGGTEWVAEVVRLFASGTLRRPMARRVSFDCDRTPIWDGRAVCPALEEPGEATMEGEGAWSGPLAVLVDGGTASASEDFVVWLRDRDGVIIAGERTYGAGCGYVNGGARARMEHLDLTVMMPNCARFTSDGVNEIEGIAPDVPLVWKSSAVAKNIEALAALARH